MPTEHEAPPVSIATGKNMRVVVSLVYLTVLLSDDVHQIIWVFNSVTMVQHYIEVMERPLPF